ncbi:MAG TPA: PaaI family thioesterase [Nitrospirota bacterium]|nr:PaaI family thioesterase [Nitrospirota bacterium]
MNTDLPRDNNRCYVCGKENPAGLGVDFAIDAAARSISARFTPKDVHQGYAGIVHGGILSALLDEAMGKLAFVLLGVPVVTAEMSVKFRTPAAPGDELRITGWITEEVNRLVRAEAKIERGLTVIAEAKGKLVKISAGDKVRSTE